MRLDPARALLVAFESPATRDLPLSGFADSPRLFRACLDTAYANGLYFPFVRQLLENRIHLPPSEGARWETERAAAARYRETLELLGEACGSAGVPYLVIKNATSVDHVPRDIDVFVADRDRPEFLRALTSRGMRLRYDDESEISLQGEGSFRIDVYSRIHYLNREFLDPAYLQASGTAARTMGIEYPTLVPEAAYLLNAAHGLFGHGAITLLDYMEFRSLAKRMGDLSACRRVADRQGWGRVFDRWTQRMDGLQVRLRTEGRPIGFPLRHGRRFVLDCVGALDGGILRPEDRRAIALSLIWDDLLFAAEGAGIDKLLSRWAVAAGLANTAGHRLRFMRGDRKRAEMNDAGNPGRAQAADGEDPAGRVGSGGIPP